MFDWSHQLSVLMGNRRRVCIVLDFYYFSCLLAIAALLFPTSELDARKSSAYALEGNSDSKMMIQRIKVLRNRVEKMEMEMEMDSSSNSQPYGVSSPFSLPPYDSLPPIPLPPNTPPFCIYPPFTPQPPSTTFPPPTAGGGGSYTPPTPPVGNQNPNPPISLSPPSYTTPTAPGIVIVPSPPGTNVVPSPWGYNVPPTPPAQFLPPIVYPAPTVPPPPQRAAPATALWCVAKPAVPEPIIQEAMNYACASGADCNQIQPSGSCYQPNTLLAHASYAFNSYWQRTKVAGGTCEFGGTAMLVTVDPSYNGCHFIFF